MDRVVPTKAFVNICTMQVCAVKDATDEEILDLCNDDNPSGTEHGWLRVIRTADENPESIFAGPNKVPVRCDAYEDRMHFLVLC